MKTAEELAVDYFGGQREEVGEDVFDEFVTLIKQRDLDAYRAGMTEAAEIVQHRQFPMQNQPFCSNDAKAILTARDNKTTI